MSKDPTAFAVVLEDGAALAGLLLAAGGVLLGHFLDQPLYDGLASIAIGLVLAAVAVLLAYESRGLLIGESAMRGVVRSIRTCAEQTVGLARVGRVLTMQLGPERVLVVLDAAFEPDLTTGQIAETAERLEASIHRVQPNIEHVFIDLHAVQPGERARSPSADAGPAG